MANYITDVQKRQNKAAMMTVVGCIPIVCDNIEDPGKRQESIDELRNNLIQLIKEEDRANKAGLALIKIQDEIMETIPEGNIVAKIEEKLKEVMAKEEKSSEEKVDVEKHEFMLAFESKVAKFM